MKLERDKLKIYIHRNFWEIWKLLRSFRVTLGVIKNLQQYRETFYSSTIRHTGL